MKVFVLPANHRGWGSCDGYQVLVAAPSSHAARSAGRQYGLTFARRSDLPPDAADAELALARPGEVFWRSGDGTDWPWRPAPDRD